MIGIYIGIDDATHVDVRLRTLVLAGKRLDPLLIAMALK